MNHPKHEEWVPYVFGEATAEARQHLRQHLEGCSECRAEIGSWQRSLSRLDAWRLSRPPRRPAAAGPVLRWAFASVLVLSLGTAFILGRLSSKPVLPPHLQESIAREVRQELRAEFDQMLRAEVARASSVTVAALRRDMANLLNEYDHTIAARLESERIQRVTECLSLKKDVDTIAINADAGLRDTEQRLAQLVVYRPVNRPSDSIDNPVHH